MENEWRPKIGNRQSREQIYRGVGDESDDGKLLNFRWGVLQQKPSCYQDAIAYVATLSGYANRQRGFLLK
jgi:hypothetical protein